MCEEFWDISVSHEASRASHKADRAVRENRDLRFAVEKLSIVTRAMWELISEKEGMHLYTLIKRINEIDLRDGVKDGRTEHKAVKCKSCGRQLHRRRQRCLYCGDERVSMDPFEVV